MKEFKKIGEILDYIVVNKNIPPGKADKKGQYPLYTCSEKLSRHSEYHYEGDNSDFDKINFTIFVFHKIHIP